MLDITGYCFFDNKGDINIVISENIETGKVLLVPIRGMQKGETYGTSCVFYKDEQIGFHTLDKDCRAVFQKANEQLYSDIVSSLNNCGTISSDTLNKLRKAAQLPNSELAKRFLRKYFDV